LPENSDAGPAAALPARRAPFCAVCWRPRALPPLRAAALRPDWERDDPDDRLRDALPERDLAAPLRLEDDEALFAPLRLDDLLRLDDEVLRAVEPPRLDDDARFAPPERDDELLRRPPVPPLPLPRPREPLDVSAISLSFSSMCAALFHLERARDERVVRQS
jgi:hypothetical protein